MEQDKFHHALKIREDVCYGCTHCMQVCPTEAIRVHNGKAKLLANRCVDCGECVRACPVDAIIVEQDDFSNIFNYKYRVALVPAILIGQFPRDIPTRRIYSALLEEGFTDVYEAEHGADVLAQEINQYVKNNPDSKPVMSSFCPAIVRLVQVKFPSMVDNIMLLKSPLDIAAMSYKKKLMDKGINENDIGIFYVTPCAAKIAAVKSPVGEEYSNIAGVINMNFIYNKIYARLNDHQRTSCVVPSKVQLSDKAMTWSLTSGESPHAKGRSLAIDGIHNVIEFLETIEDEDHGRFDFLELRACDQSCAGGILNPTNRFLTNERLHNRAAQYRTDKRAGKITGPARHSDHQRFLKDNIGISKVNPRSMLKLDDDMVEALKKMERVRNIMCFLPGIDCGGCGSPACESLAQDIVKKGAEISDCVFVQKKMQVSKKLSAGHCIRIVDKIWGKDRLEKDCSKKGAKNEGS